jgi:hypothetical protein
MDMSSAPNPGDGQDVLFDELIGEIQDLMSSTPSLGHQTCAQALRDASSSISDNVKQLEADTKAHPNHKTANDKQISRLVASLARSLVNYIRCMHLAIPKALPR